MRENLGYYVLIGLIYVLVNIFIRKLHHHARTDEANIMVLVWWFLWPICWLCLIVDGFIKLVKTKRV